jgi:hypothetical protein
MMNTLSADGGARVKRVCNARIPAGCFYKFKESEKVTARRRKGIDD